MLGIVRINDLALAGELVETHFLGADHGARDEIDPVVVDQVERVRGGLIPFETDRRGRAA